MPSRPTWSSSMSPAPALDAAEVSKRLRTHGVRIGAVSDRRMRAVTHLDIDAAGVEEAARALARVLGA